MSLPLQIGPNILDLEAQQIAQPRWMVQQQQRMMNPSLPTESSNHYPSTISAGIFPQEYSNGMRSSGIASSGGKFSVSMLESTPEHWHMEFVTLMHHYNTPKRQPLLYPSAVSQTAEKLDSQLVLFPRLPAQQLLLFHYTLNSAMPYMYV
jgi:hypothetical protein